MPAALWAVVLLAACSAPPPASAKAALGASRASGDRAEAANALRLLGTTAIGAGDAGAATGYLEEALAIDRELAVRALHKTFGLDQPA